MSDKAIFPLINISIPHGTIKRSQPGHVFKSFSIFQYLMVQLKGPEEGDNEYKTTFQYLMVQLKVRKTK